MQFPNRSIATAGIGIACALVLLVVLSWPALFGATTASNLTPQPTYTSNSATTVYETSVSTSKITSTVSSATVVETAVAVSTIAASSTVGNSSNGIIPGTGDTMTSITSEATTTVASGTVMSSANVQSSPLAQPLFAFNYGSVSGTASDSTNLSAFLMLAIISIVSFVIAASSMLFMKRRENSEKS